MNGFNQVLLILHFVGLAMGLSVSFATAVMMGLVAKAAPNEKAVLGRFLPAMSRVGEVGLGLLWVTGVTMVFTKWGGFAALPWQFHVKLTAVVLLTVTVAYLKVQIRKAQAGDQSAMARIPRFGPLAALFALVAVVFAVLTFD